MLEQARQILNQYYGYETFREGQEQIIHSILQRKDTFGIMPTGGGKSICFQIPALLFSGITLVISPLISLMKDQTQALEQLDIPATFINSSLDFYDVMDRIEACKNGLYKLIYVAPERLESEEFQEIAKYLSIDLIAIDEAHCVSQWGHDFRSSYRNISSFVQKLERRPTIAAFTATATEEVKEDVVKLLHLKNPNVFITGFDRGNLYFSVQKGVDKKQFLLHYLEEHKEEVGIIYTATRKETDQLFKLLDQKKYRAARYHAGMNDFRRNKAQEAFIYDDVNVIVATNAFGMGIDKSNVRFVIHYNMPKNLEAYYQEAGRAGRDGEPSECILLFSPQDEVLQRYMIDSSQLTPQRKKYEYARLKTMSDYCHTTKCLRNHILTYFGEHNTKEKCDNCSTCIDKTESVDITIDAQKIFSCIYRIREQFGVTMITNILNGSKNKKVKQQGFDMLPTYGIMGQYSAKQITQIIRGLIADGYLTLTEHKYPVVKLQKTAIDVLKNKEKVYQKVHRKEEKVKVDNALFEILRDIRKEISTREKVPPYVIFHDSTLREMSEYFPVNQQALRKIKGIGQAKIEKYGEAFLNAIQQYVEQHNIIPLPKEQQSKSHISDQSDIKSYVVTFHMYEQGKSIADIAKEREIKPVTIQDHLIRCALEGMEVNLDDFIPAEYEVLIKETIQKVGGEKLKPIKEALPKEIDYMMIKAVLMKYHT